MTDDKLVTVAAVSVTVGATESIVSEPTEADDKFPAVSCAYNRYTPSVNPARDRLVAVFAVAIVTDVHTLLLAEVMLDTLVTVTLLRTRYAIPTSFT